MLTINISEVPAYLQKGKFYRALEKTDQSVPLRIPQNSFKEDDSINSNDDFIQLLHALKFWGVDELPSGLIDYCFMHDISLWKPLLIDVMDEEDVHASALLDIFGVSRDQQLAVAVRVGRMDLLSFLVPISKSYSNVNLSSTVARLGHLDCLTLLHEQGCPWDTDTYIGAIEGGHFDCFVFAHTHGLEWHPSVSDAAAKQGRPDLLRYALDHGCPHSANIVQLAAEGGRLDCLKYLIGEKHLPADEAVFGAAFVRADVCNVQYLLEAGCPYQGYQFSGELDWHYPTTDKMDGNFMLCLDFAQDYGWSPSAELRQYVQRHAQELPLCYAYMANMA